jgi:SAM-dependent methyltransferase
MESIFTKVYKLNTWGDNESRSGAGSNYEQTANIREQIVILIKKFNIKSVLDVPCGDFNWFKHIVPCIQTYIGADIVQPLIEMNKRLYNNSFITFDITTDPIPEGIEMIFCRDLLVHFPLDSIIQTLNNIKKSNAKYLLMTTFINRDFCNIEVEAEVGCWRPISFFDKPFNFPKPLTIINERCTESYPLYIDKSLGLWLIKDLPDL